MTSTPAILVCRICLPDRAARCRPCLLHMPPPPGCTYFKAQSSVCVFRARQLGSASNGAEAGWSPPCASPCCSRWLAQTALGARNCEWQCWLLRRSCFSSGRKPFGGSAVGEIRLGRVLWSAVSAPGGRGDRGRAGTPNRETHGCCWQQRGISRRLRQRHTTYVARYADISWRKDCVDPDAIQEGRP